MKLDSKKRPGLAQAMRIEPTDLHLTVGLGEGGSQRIVMEANGDLSVMLAEGCRVSAGAQSVPGLATTGGTLVISLDVDGEYDMVQYEGADVEEMLSEAIETLWACRDAVRAVRSL